MTLRQEVHAAHCKQCGKGFMRFYVKGQIRRPVEYCSDECREKIRKARDRERLNSITICAMQGCRNESPIGYIKCLDCSREHDRKRRELKADATYIDLTHLDITCYLCGSTGPFHVDHIFPLARFHELVSEAPETPYSAVRKACASCNLSKSARDPAEFILDRWRSGKPVVQAEVLSLTGYLTTKSEGSQ